MTRPVRSEPPKLSTMKALLQEVMAEPGEWFLVKDTYANANSAAAVASELRKGRRNIPAGRWEFRDGPAPTPNKAKRWGVWAKYLGPVE